ncbi:MAG: hypothetical protein QW587_03745 [Candidatus Bathyarchaeia archaeon]
METTLPLGRGPCSGGLLLKVAAYNAGRMNLDAIKRGLQSLQDTA